MSAKQVSRDPCIAALLWLLWSQMAVGGEGGGSARQPAIDRASLFPNPGGRAKMAAAGQANRVRGGARCAARWLALRGGGDGNDDVELYSEDPRRTGPVRRVVPKQYESLWDCIFEARTGDSIFLQGLPHHYRSFEGGEWGWHSWECPLYVTNECLWRSRKQGFPHSGAR
jgi:hypothetical protein